MDSSTITLEELQPEWLHERLTRNGHLTEGRVTQIERVETTRTHLSDIRRFRAHYSAESSAPRPDRLVLKTSRPELSPMGQREVDVYRSVAKMMPQGPLVPCYDASFDAATGSYHVLLEDMSATHRVSTDGLPPSRQDAEQMIDALARLHAFWWDHPELGQRIGRIPTEYDVRRTVGHAKCYYEPFLELLGDRLSGAGRAVFEAAFDEHAACLTKRLQDSALTLVHGDAHAGNFLVPTTGDAEGAYLIDWQTPPWVWECGLGAWDVAYLMVRYWPAERRRELEDDLLDRYHAGLVARGVRDYSRSALSVDYLHGCLLNLYVVIEESVRTEPWRWYGQLVNVLSAVGDRDALGVLSGASLVEEATGRTGSCT